MNLGDPVKRGLTLRRTLDLRRDELRFAGELLHRHRDVLVLIETLKRWYVFGGWVQHHEFDRGHVLPSLPSHRDCAVVPPNASRLSCGRHTDGRKAVEQQTKRLAGEATQFLPTCERPAASSAC